MLFAVFVLQILIGIPFYYTEFTSGPAMFFGYPVYRYTTHTMVCDLCDPPLRMPLVALIICDLLLFPARFAGKIAGRTKRKKDKRELTGN